MKTALPMLMLVLLTQGPVFADHKAERQACEAVKQKIRVIEAKMRDGYTAAQGIRYETRLRELKKKRYKLCR